jgi:hypothetical protein
LLQEPSAQQSPQGQLPAQQSCAFGVCACVLFAEYPTATAAKRAAVAMMSCSFFILFEFLN